MVTMQLEPPQVEPAGRATPAACAAQLRAGFLITEDDEGKKMTTDYDSLEAEAAAMLRQCAPEHSGVQIYFHDQPAPVGSRSPVAWTSPQADTMILALRHELGTRRGLGIFYNSVLIRDLAGFDPEATRGCFLSVMLHEGIHGVAEWLDGIEQRPAAAMSDAKSAAIAWRSKHAKPETPTHSALHDEKDFRDHNGAFLRCATHCHFRATSHGFPVIRPLVFGSQVDRSPSWKYHRALLPELHRMRNWPFARILRTASPRSFRKLLAADLERHVDGKLAALGFEPDKLTPTAHAFLSKQVRAGSL